MMSYRPPVCIKRPPTFLLLCLFLSWGSGMTQARAGNDVQFNTDILDLKDRANIDLSQFARAGYIMPGEYNLALHVNRQSLPEQKVSFLVPDGDPKGSEACLTPAMVGLLGLKEDAMHHLTWWHQGQCLDIHSLKGMEVRGDVGELALYLSIPQAYLEYNSADWDPPSRWDEGIAGVLFDYNLNTQVNHNQKQGGEDVTVSGNGTAGGNLGAWRVRADWQMQQARRAGEGTTRSWDWSRYYAYRAIGSLRDKLMVGENYLDSGLFDSFRYAGASLSSDENMLPPALRGYAPEVTGIARTNARVTISQQGRVVYDAQVAAGPFRIQDLSEAIAGKLDVVVQEQDGTRQTFQVTTASIPYLTRPGAVRYKLAVGKPSDIKHHISGPEFATGEFSWGVNNGWSLYGGSLAGKDYDAAAVGVGRDLLALGAISFDVTGSRAQLPGEGVKQGTSWRVNYSKRFDQYDSQVSFAGYRFSEKQFMSMSEYLDALEAHSRGHSSKEMYTISFNKQFRDAGLSAYVNYYHQTYWDAPDSDRYNVSLAKTFSLGAIRDVSASLSLSRTRSYNTDDDAVFLSLSLPWGTNDSLSYNAGLEHGSSSQEVSYYHQVDAHNNYQLRTGITQNSGSASGYINHSGDSAQMSASVNYQSGQYSSLGMSMRGGMTATANGVALHRVNAPGSTRLMLDTDGVAGVPVHGYGTTSLTNAFGKAVTTDVNSYYRNEASIDLNALGDNVEATQSVEEATLTEGAIGYRRFEVVAGMKAMASIHLPDGTTPPFGATVTDDKQHETGIINDGGSVYLSGIRADETMLLHWDGRPQCAVTLPHTLPAAEMSTLLLPCHAVGAVAQKATAPVVNRAHS